VVSFLAVSDYSPSWYQSRNNATKTEVRGLCRGQRFFLFPLSPFLEISSFFCHVLKNTSIIINCNQSVLGGIDLSS